MKRFTAISMLICAFIAVSGCAYMTPAEVHPVTVDPYRPVSDDDPRAEECTIQLGDSVSVCGQGAWYKDNDILISRGGSYIISGTYTSGCIKVSTNDTVKLVFSNADISNPDGCAVFSDSGKLIIASDGDSTITGGGERGSAVQCDGALLFTGLGDIVIDGGIYSRGGIRFGGSVQTMCEILRTYEGDYIRGKLSIKGSGQPDADNA